MTKKEKILLFGLLALVLAVGIAAIVVASTNQPQTIINDFVAPGFDTTAVSGTPELQLDDRGYGTLMLQEYAQVAMCANVYMEGNLAQLYLTAPETNTCWVRVKIYSPSGELLGESGLVCPGQYIPGVTLSTVPEPGTLVTVRILLYEPETYISLGAAGAQVCIVAE